MSKSPEKRGQFGSSLGFVLASAGSAVGLGNIWKFPRMAFNYGGGAFILIYIFIVVFIGATVMLTELTIGRKVHKNCVGALRTLNKKWSFIGGLGILTGFIILSYYSHVGGWVLKYAVGYLFTPEVIFNDPTSFLVENVLGASSFPIEGAIIYPAIVMLITVFIVIKGISGGIEKTNKILMPALFIMLIIMGIRGLTMPGASEGIAHLLTIDFSTLTPNTIMQALGQAFFSLSLGMGVMCTYGSYLSNDSDLVKDTFTICGLDSAVALIASFAIIPIAFSAGLEIPGGAGSAGFGFISMAEAFKTMPAGQIFGFIFYFLMFFAAITSAISILEGTVAFFSEEFKLSRAKTAIALALIMYFLGMFYTLSQANMDLKLPWMDANGITYPIVGDWMEFTTDKLLMPLGALLFCIFAGWIWGVDNVSAEIESSGMKFKLKKTYTFCVKYLAPIAITVILLSGFGFINL